jgi:hypothetical protein
MKIIYDEIEPFGGLREDTQEVGWDQIKQNFLKRKREKGVYLYHKNKGSPSFCLFYVSASGEAHEYLPPSKDNTVFDIYTYPDKLNEDFLKTLMLIKENNGKFYNKLKEELKKEHITNSIYEVVKKDTQKFQSIVNPIIAELNRANGNVDVWGKYLEEYKIHFNDNKSYFISNDVGIIGATPNRGGTFLAFLDNPTERKLMTLGYSSNTSIMSATSKERSTVDPYNETVLRGKTEHDIRDDIQSALEGSKSIEVGWASNPAETK